MSHGVRVVAWTLVAVPLPLAVALHLLLTLPVILDESMFVAGVVAFAIGAFAVLGRDDEDWDGRAGDAEPPWWPQFERQLRIYSTTRPPRDRTVVR
jgi:hypothetical protein